MKSSVKKIIIFLAIIFLLFSYAGLRTYNSHNKDQVISSEDQKNYSEEKSESNRKFEIEEVSDEKKKQIEESLGYEISKIRQIKFFEDEDYIKQELKNKKSVSLRSKNQLRHKIGVSYYPHFWKLVFRQWRLHLEW